MGPLCRHTPPLLLLLAALVAAASAATLQPQPQALVAGYGKEFQPFGTFNGIPIALRLAPWIRAAEIQSADAIAYPGERQLYPERPAPPQQVPPADGPLYQRMGPPPGLQLPRDEGPVYQQRMGPVPQQQLLPDDAIFRQRMGSPPPPQLSQPDVFFQQRMIPGPAPYSGDQEQQTEQHSNDQAPEQQRQAEQQVIFRSDDNPGAQPLQMEEDQQPAMSGDPVRPDSPAEENVQVQLPSAGQEPSVQESADGSAQGTKQDSSAAQDSGFMPYQEQGQRPFGVIFSSDPPVSQLELGPPPAYRPAQMVSWGVHPVQVPVYPASFRERLAQQEQQPEASAAVDPPPAAYPDEWEPQVMGYPPVRYQRPAYDLPRVGFGVPPIADDRMGMVPPPPGGVSPFLMPSSYVPETPLEETSQAEVVPDKNEQSESRENEKSKDDDADDDDDEGSDEIENKVKALKDAVDVEEEVVPALVVFLRKKGHKVFHNKDSVGIPGKEDRFRRSPGGSGSSSHSSSSSSSSSSSGPVYFGDGSGSYSSSSSQSSSSSGSGGGAPLGLGASGPGGGGAFYGGGGHIPSSGYGVTGGGGGGYGNNGYGNTGYGGNAGNAGYGGNSGYGGNTGYGNSGYGGAGGGGGGGYGGGHGGAAPSGGGGYGGGGCATCGGDGNVLLNRFGEVDGPGPVTLGGSGSSKGQGVHSSASSSIDSTGKVTYTAFAGKH